MILEMPQKDIDHSHIEPEDAAHLYAFLIEQIGEEKRGVVLRDKALSCKSCFEIYSIVWSELQLARRKT